MAHPGAGGTGGRGGSFSKSHHQQQKPPLFTGDLNLESVNLILYMVEPWVHNSNDAQCTTQLNRGNNSASQCMDPEVYSSIAHRIWHQCFTDISPPDGAYAPVTWLRLTSAFDQDFVLDVTITDVRQMTYIPYHCQWLEKLHTLIYTPPTISTCSQKRPLICGRVICAPSAVQIWVWELLIRSSPPAAWEEPCSQMPRSHAPMI